MSYKQVLSKKERECKSHIVLEPITVPDLGTFSEDYLVGEALSPIISLACTQKRDGESSERRQPEELGQQYLPEQQPFIQLPPMNLSIFCCITDQEKADAAISRQNARIRTHREAKARRERAKRINRKLNAR